MYLDMTDSRPILNIEYSFAGMVDHSILPVCRDRGNLLKSPLRGALAGEMLETKSAVGDGAGDEVG